MKVTVCIGRACHLQGTRQVVEILQTLISENGLREQIDLDGKNCMGNCQHGVCLNIDGVDFSVSPENVAELFRKEILPKLRT